MKILVCPLNWGLGHATRCIPLIHKLVSEGHELVIVSDGFPLETIKMRFPDLRYITYPSYTVRYSSGKSQILAMLWNLPSIIYGIYSEHQWLKALLIKEHFDQVISDNRFGMWSKETYSIYITHQLLLKMPRGFKFLEPLGRLFHNSFIKKYDECWVPDVEGPYNLSGDLSHKYALPRNAKFIGLLSRFNLMDTDKINYSYDTVAVLSGVEPQRAIFENQLIRRFRRSGQKVLIVCGQPASKKRSYHVGDVTIVSHLCDDELVPILRGATKIISRSGYSSIMDLKTLGCFSKVELIPTPGQTEQEYLSELHGSKNKFYKTEDPVMIASESVI